ncbi:MAG: DUF4278 domain-containing protein [Cyanobacteriota bacterium]|nr:DUF4278 domain-containing protein [Cyanobacteriota bacterium]
MTTPLRYRGVAYDANTHEQASDRPVTHVYRGRAYSAPLRHPVIAADHEAKLCYRGQPYHSHRDQVGCH